MLVFYHTHTHTLTLTLILSIELNRTKFYTVMFVRILWIFAEVANVLLGKKKHSQYAK